MKKKTLLPLTIVLLVLITTTTVYAVGVNDISWASLGISPPYGTCDAIVGLTDGSEYILLGTYKIIAAKNAGENLLFTCKGTLRADTPPPPYAIRVNSDRSDFTFACYDGNDFVPSNNWWIDITPSGNATYKCHVNPGR